MYTKQLLYTPDYKYERLGGLTSHTLLVVKGLGVARQKDALDPDVQVTTSVRTHSNNFNSCYK